MAFNSTLGTHKTYPILPLSSLFLQVQREFPVAIQTKIQSFRKNAHTPVNKTNLCIQFWRLKCFILVKYAYGISPLHFVYIFRITSTIQHTGMTLYFHLSRTNAYKVSSYDVQGHHDHVIKWKHVSRYWPFLWGIHRSPVNSLHKGQWHGTLMFSLICARINCWVNTREAGDLRRHRARHDVIVMIDDACRKGVTEFVSLFDSNARKPYGAWFIYDDFCGQC